MPLKVSSNVSFVSSQVTIQWMACFLERLGGLEISEWKEACHPVNGYVLSGTTINGHYRRHEKRMMISKRMENKKGRVKVPEKSGRSGAGVGVSSYI